MKSSNRIIFVPFIAALGGVERLILDLSTFLHERGVAHTVVCFRQELDLQSYSDLPLEVCELRPMRTPLLEAQALKNYLRSSPGFAEYAPLLFDLKSAFYSGLASAGPFVLHLTDPPSLLPADISKHAPSVKKHLGGAHDGQGRAGRLSAEIVHRVNRRGARRASKLIAMTEKIRAELRSLYDVDAVVIRPGVTTATLEDRTLAADRSSAFRILSVSRLEPSKRIDWILKALATIDEKVDGTTPNWRFEIAGEGSETASLKRLAIDLGLQDRTSFLGHLRNEELAAAYARTHLFVMPAVQGYGLPALEALSRSIPIIVHKDSGVSEILKGNPWVEIVDGNGSSLSRAISAMMGRVAGDALETCERPKVPTSSDWAKHISVECGWLTSAV